MRRYLRRAGWTSTKQKAKAPGDIAQGPAAEFSRQSTPEYRMITYFCEKVMVFHLLNRPQRADDAYERFFL
ncbi:hypothetical protein SAMN04488090_0385 [Siphonobacter aquaeclarae]|uniref:Uncharacterized protein n=1 Tax=Siphonobacter aquaeclarae TaxID=563176 RepID=A0A1G9I999_9BACT|nr:hypothetical protein SAMN04488090_0385 [Siphonobacter aquaeclarae]